MNAVPQYTPPVLQRYELKFFVPESLIEPISQFVSVYCTLDKYSETASDHFYTINNLYIDSPQLTFLKNRINNKDNRFNMRIRTYGNNPQPPYFLEIKQKSGSVLRKIRGKIGQREWPHVLKDPLFLLKETSDQKNCDNISTYIRLALTYNAEPKVFAQYKRKAYFSICDDYARVTFDKSLRYRPENDYIIMPDAESLLPCDHPAVFGNRGNVVLELKCYTTYVPLWMIDLIRTFQLQRTSFSKYVNAMREYYKTLKFSDEAIITPCEMNPNHNMTFYPDTSFSAG